MGEAHAPTVSPASGETVPRQSPWGQARRAVGAKPPCKKPQAKRTRLAPALSGLPCAPRPGRPMTSFSSRELALHTVRLALDKGGEDVRLLQLPKGNGVADFVVIVSGRSDRNVHAIVQGIYSF